jgi:serine-type D-Ala-D-Ala endopeptidase (penicillin-binding protein 7)
MCRVSQNIWCLVVQVLSCLWFIGYPIHAGAASAAKTKAPVVQAPPPVGESSGLVLEPDPIGLKSSAALVVDNKSGKLLVDKNAKAILPIASLTKLMMALVVFEGRQAMQERIEITADDIDREKNSRSRLTTGSVLQRQELLQIALMSSDNRAASALSRNYPGGKQGFVRAMNEKARALGMSATEFADASGLSPNNTSSAQDLLKLTLATSKNARLSEMTVADEISVKVSSSKGGDRPRTFGNSNRLIKSKSWDLKLQKTGFTSEAGSCLILLGKVDGRSVTIVLLGSSGRLSKFGDAHRIREWLAK